VRVVAVSHSAWLGGAERNLAELVRALDGAADVHVVLPRDGALRELLAAPVSVVPGRWWGTDEGRPRADPLAVGRMARVLRRLRPDVVLSASMVHPPGALAARALGIPHVWWVQEFGDRDHGYRFLLGARGTRRAIRALSRVVLAPSRAVAAELGGGARVAPAWVDVPPRPPAPAGGRRLALLGRIRPSKGQDDAVRALVRLPGAELDLVGDGDVAWIERVAVEAGVRERVHVHGGLADPLAVLDGADVALMCSRNEAMGRVTVEAMKRGKPVVGAAAGGTLEVLDEGRAGVLYSAGDPEALAAAVGRVLADPAPVAWAGHRHATRTYTRERLRDGMLAALAEATA
jgi:glycosyltransferase involved in cell wall biosynthesis